MNAGDIKKLIKFRHEGHSWSECALQFNLNWAASAQILYMKNTDLRERLPVKRKRSPNGSNAAMAAKAALAAQRANKALSKVNATPSETNRPHTYDERRKTPML